MTTSAPIFATLAILITAVPLAAADEWLPLTSRDGMISVMVPGKAERREQKRKVLLAEITTYIARYQTDSVIFDLAHTPMKERLINFAGKDKIAENAKGSILERVMGREKAFKDTVIDGTTVKYLEYEMPNSKDPKGPRLLGYALIYVADDALYVANGAVISGSGEADLKKFAGSISIKK